MRAWEVFKVCFRVYVDLHLNNPMLHRCETIFFSKQRSCAGRPAVIPKSGISIGTPRCVECKLSRREVNPALLHFKQRYPSVDAVQVCPEAGPDVRSKGNIRIVSAHEFTAELV